MGWVKKILAGVVGIISFFMAYTGTIVYLWTNGTVRGSEFSMLITITNLFALFLIWASTFALWRVIPEGKSVGEVAKNSQDEENKVV